MTGPLMEDMTWTEIQQAAEDGYVPIWVIGATEQHGPHLPIRTDTFIPVELAKAVSRQLDTLVQVPLPFGFKSKALSGGGQGFPGTLSLSGTTLIALVTDIVSEIARAGFRNLVVLNWHMENINFVWEGIDQARLAGRLGEMKVMSIDESERSLDLDSLDWLFADGFPGWDVEHAAIVETSMMLALDPDSVRRDKIADDSSKVHPWYDLVPEPEAHIPSSGVLSRASLGTAEKGRRFFDLLVENLVGAISSEFDLPRRRP